MPAFSPVQRCAYVAFSGCERACCARSGIEKSKADVVSVVHVGEATLAKRVREFVLTASGGLTAEEFEARGREWDAEARAALSIGAPAPSADAGGCMHLGEPRQNPQTWTPSSSSRAASPTRGRPPACPAGCTVQPVARPLV